WTTSGTDVFLSTLTDYVGIGTNDPNKQLHLKTASGNAELDIQSGSQNYWAIYQDGTTEQLRFWNADFAGDVGPGVGNIFVIDNDGTVLVKTPVDGDSDNAVATKGYVDAAAGGGGDATLANQLSIMGTDFDQSLDSLKIISDKIGEANDSPTLGSSIFAAVGFLANKIIELQDIVQDYSIQAGDYFGNGGNIYYCQKKTISAGGQVTYTSINNNLQCDAGKVCSNGYCGTALTFSSSTHSETECTNLGGTVFNTGSRTACEFSSPNCPSGWTQADSWQRYASWSWGGDSCGRWTSSGWAGSLDNSSSSCVTPGPYIIGNTYNCTENTDKWHTEYLGQLFSVIVSSNCSTNRVGIGCY
ncbi:MAG: hypothetical protein WC323_02880, partial [Patescibacteria group bacterium]